MTSLVEFLTARLDEFTDSYAVDPEPVGLNEVMFAGACRQLQGFYTAARAILELHTGSHECSSFDEMSGEYDNCCWIMDDNKQGICSTARFLAAPFASHPSFDPSWVVETP